mgnify:CR=1 FL=1
MKKIVVGGQMEKKHIASLIGKIAGDKASIKTMSDIEAAMAIKSGAADYYFGACNTGGGGALAMAIAILNLLLTFDFPRDCDPGAVAVLHGIHAGENQK